MPNPCPERSAAQPRDLSQAPRSLDCTRDDGYEAVMRNVIPSEAQRSRGILAQPIDPSTSLGMTHSEAVDAA